MEEPVPIDLVSLEDNREKINDLVLRLKFQCYHEKIAQDCCQLAEMYSLMKEFNKAAPQCKENCDNGYGPNNCYKYAVYKLQGKGVKEDPVKALQYMKKGCEGGHPKACNLAARLQRDERFPELRDIGGSLEALQKACEAGDPGSCSTLCSMYIKGHQGVEKSPLKAFEYAKKGCDLGSKQSCYNASVMYKMGDGVEKNQELHEKYKKKFMDLRKGGWVE